MGKHVKKWLNIALTVVLGLVGIKWPILRETIDEVKEEIEEIINDENYDDEEKK